MNKVAAITVLAIGLSGCTPEQRMTTTTADARSAARAFSRLGRSSVPTPGTRGHLFDFSYILGRAQPRTRSREEGHAAVQKQLATFR